MRASKAVSITMLVFSVISLPTRAQEDQVPEPSQKVDAPFRLFRTLNIHTFLKLDTRTGQVWQLQWSTDGNSGLIPINLKPLASDRIPGRFTLYPTQEYFYFCDA